MLFNHYEPYTVKLSQHGDDILEMVTIGNHESENVIVLLHGAIMNYKIMTVFAKYLHHAKLIFINSPGRGKSSALTRMDHNLEDYATRINEALQLELAGSQIKRMAMIGYSMGGLIATKIAGYNTLPITHLIYLNSAAKIDYKELRLSKLFYELIKDIKPDQQDGMIKSIPEFILEQGVSKKHNDKFNFTEYLAPVDAMITDLMYTLKADYLEDIDKIEHMPKVLFLLGEDDVIFPNKDSAITVEKFEARNAEVKSIIYPEVGHLDFLRVLDQDAGNNLGSIEYNINMWLNMGE
ncbi:MULTISPECIES: alpha/beta fold hydrolase [Staphylococcus]|uniref:Alpha/beta hydrolase n=1 Tax=Staphylococcus chromogenes TaxID=46126 RepID=A0AAE5SZJ2_STACR|nr:MULTISPECIES: alpha/beta hydrolase [Staphylococcus]KDP12330.1 putative esterase [Staphylococcus chromogenes MU 970]MBP0046719.1 alpha/beta hydrolase [Staphylococcus chromogenes]MBV5137232.1 alpha/beta hydrolase [Staphylococcus chromogenes]MBV5192339.1 alpha/beta hydrolase [Staphylococcus chromogenes]MBW3133157.1 alpha/beta hydrolase [Staphylococcus chromogenes]